ncbi:MAG: YceG family protein [Cellulosilyticaceae bacterium]
MTITLEQLTRSNGDKQNRPYFYRFIGVEPTSNYDDVLRTLVDKWQSQANKCIIFDNEIPMQGEMELIEYIYNELKTMNINNIQGDDIVIFESLEVNDKFLSALNHIITLACQRENFFSESVRNNFITKLIVWAYSYLREIDFSLEGRPKCMYYGSIERHEIYYLILLYLMHFDVIYINPLKEEYFEEIDQEGLSTCIKSLGIAAVESLEQRIDRGQVIEYVETVTKQIEREVQEELFAGIGVYKPWQFRKGYTKAVLYNTTLDEIFSYWNEPSRLREGFRVDGDVVQVPCFFYKIDGEYVDKLAYQKLVKYCVESPCTVFLNHGDLSDTQQLTDDIYQLMFCQLSDGTFDIEEIKKISLYRFGKYSTEVQNFILNKFNEVIKKEDLFGYKLEKESTLKFLVEVLHLNDEIVKSINNFDFTGNIPKLVIYLNNEEDISDKMVRLMGYLHHIGMDIVIFNPSGMFNINKVLQEGVVNVVRLDQMAYQSTYQGLMNMKQTLLSKILKRRGGM